MLKLAVVMNAQGVIEAWTLLAEELFGFSAEEALGKPLGDLIVPEAIELELIEKVRAEEEAKKAARKAAAAEKKRIAAEKKASSS